MYTFKQFLKENPDTYYGAANHICIDKRMNMETIYTMSEELE